MTLSVTGLPQGLTLDSATGNITGTTTALGPHVVTITATNAVGTDKASLTIIIGSTICLTPAMGWNSWNFFEKRVTEKNIKDAADAMVSTGLIEHGWTYVNIDDTWEGKRDDQGRITGNEKFPDMKALGDYIHAKSLKYGIYSSPGPKTCAGFEGSYQHEEIDAQTYASWGVDYVKFDKCSYNAVVEEITSARYAALLGAEAKGYERMLVEQRAMNGRKDKLTPEESARFKAIEALLAKNPKAKDAIHLEEMQRSHRLFGDALVKTNRDIVYSVTDPPGVNRWGPGLGINSWRTTGDIRPTWDSVSKIGFNQDRMAGYASAGHYNDPDMLEIGNPGLSPDECYSHMSLWCILMAPLLIGCDMSNMDAFAISLFSNDEVIAVNQDALTQQGRRLKQVGNLEVWTKPLADGSMAVGLFNRDTAPATVEASWEELKFPADSTIRDLWRQVNLPPGSKVSMTVAGHGAELLRIIKKQPKQ